MDHLVYIKKKTKKRVNAFSILNVCNRGPVCIFAPSSSIIPPYTVIHDCAHVPFSSHWLNYSTRAFGRFISPPARHEPVVTSVERIQMRDRRDRDVSRRECCISRWMLPSATERFSRPTERSPGTGLFICRVTQRASAHHRVLSGRLFFDDI